MTKEQFQEEIRIGIPDTLPEPKAYDKEINHAPKRKEILTDEEKKLALRNALRYFPKHLHAKLAPEFLEELHEYGRIYMYRYRPDYEMYARSISDYPHRSEQAAAIMLMIQNNLDPAVAQHPHELITYGGNGAVFQNWAQYRLVMKYLSEMTDEQTLVMYSGHPLGLFPSHKNAPRVVVTNGMVIPNYSKPDDWERMNALGVSQYGQMTAGSYMYIGPQGIVHGTTITVLNAARKQMKKPGGPTDIHGMLFVSSGLGGMSGAQPKAGNIAGVVSIVAEINPLAAEKRHAQGWVDELHYSLDELIPAVRKAMEEKRTVSMAYVGNVVDLWERLADENMHVDLGSDQTSLHNPWAGGYYPVGVSLEESKRLMAEEPEKFRDLVQESLRRQVAAINKLTAKGMYFFDYGNAFLLQAKRAGADIVMPDGKFRYPSYVQDIMGPMFFDYGFGPFRWVCTSGDPKDLATTDRIAAEVMEQIKAEAPEEIQGQMDDNIHWIKEAGKNHLVVGSQARILYADCEGRTKIALAFNEAIKKGEISKPVVLGRDHHDVSGTDSPFRETSNIYDGSQFCADMAVQNVIGDSFRGATWVSIHNGGGVGWGEVINGGFGMVINGDADSDRHIREMLLWDVNNGIARRSWARNSGSMTSIEREMLRTPGLQVTMPSIVDDEIINNIL
ncbi:MULTISPECIES: urocanate hydratase [Prevotella]|jgi:urocanate hydratase|uniref:Urocanate hydratase n=1 Tax=Prevotella pectinovora TaxID=1602169 RepID=A0A0D0IX46_9BACT|nr:MULTISPECIES: urocanate hydratase [Prevotella]KIP60095.1 urocanate hydratase [Prevotella pectinovora]MCI6048699.1 urocanate hydratase [Prevotella pectinovora]MDD7743107.1 urocanate hydratase [Prevotella pectinovora]MEE1546376.1 urocanate hydratase [Prevotella pectinovora]CDD04058.1 urocanate hydratase [Prevotella sp. CAG:592]